MFKTGSRLIAALLVASLGMGCTTAYDRYGRPHEVIEPGAAIVGAAAIGLIAYGLASSGHREHHEPHYQPRSYDHGYHGHGHYYEPAPCHY